MTEVPSGRVHMHNAGNRYQLEDVGNGVVSFRHIQTGEILHGSVGPEKEARELYLAASGLIANPSECLVVFDIGLGCAAQLLALLEFMKSTEAHCKHLRIFSFDLEKEGLKAIIENADHFPSAKGHREFLTQACEQDQLTLSTANGKQVDWQFIGGDFRETIKSLKKNEPALKVDAIFYDFFSPASHPWLWTFDLFEQLAFFRKNTTRLITYSSATCVKAALAAAGWFVGHTIASGKKAKSIIAAGSIAEVSDPLTAKFLSTFVNSHKPFCESESEESKKLIHERLHKHPQFCVPSSI